MRIEIRIKNKETQKSKSLTIETHENEYEIREKLKETLKNERNNLKMIDIQKSMTDK